MRVDGYVRIPDAEYVEMARHMRHYHMEMPGLMALALAAQRGLDEGHWLAIDAEGHVGESPAMPVWKLALYMCASGFAAGLLGAVLGSVFSDRVTVVTP